MSIVPEEPPAPAARVEVGLAFRTDSLWSATARRRNAARGPPGGAGEEGRPTDDTDPDETPGPPADLASGPDSVPDVKGDEGRAEACRLGQFQSSSSVGRRLIRDPPLPATVNLEILLREQNRAEKGLRMNFWPVLDAA